MNGFFSTLPLNFCNKKQEIEVDTWVAGITRFRSKKILNTILIIFAAAVFISGMWCPQKAWATDYSFLSKINKSTYPEDHLILTKENERITCAMDGTHTDHDEVFLTILDGEGKSQEGVQSFYINKKYSHLKIKYIEVIKPVKNTGNDFKYRVIPVDIEKNSREEAPGSSTDMNIYDPSQKILKVFIPDLEPGDTIHYLTIRKTFKPVIKGQVYGLIPVQQEFSVRSYHFEIVLPKIKKINFLIKNEISGTVNFHTRIKGNLKTLAWDFKNIPRLVPEPDMVSFVNVAMRLLFSSLDSWEQVSKWYFNLSEPKLSPDAAIKKKVIELTASKTGDMDKIGALFYFVAQKIRYMGIMAESNRPGFEPHDVNLTFSRRYGVCRDKAALLVSMLRAAGFKAAPVLLSAGRKLDTEIAIPYFNHAIVAVLTKEAMPLLFLDPTSETSRQFLPDYDRDCSFLVASSMPQTLGLTPVLLPDKNLFAVRVKDILSSKGKLTGQIHAVSKGFADTIFRSIMLNQTHEEQKRFLYRFLLRKRNNMVLKNLVWSDPVARNIPFNFSCDFSIKNVWLPWTGSGKKAFLPLSSTPWPGLMDRWIIGRADLTKRNYPLKTSYVFATKWTEDIRFEEKWKKLRLPCFSNTDNGVLVSETGFDITKNSLRINRYSALKKLEVSAGEYGLLTRLQHDLKYGAFLPVIISDKNKSRRK